MLSALARTAESASVDASRSGSPDGVTVLTPECRELTRTLGPPRAHWVPSSGRHSAMGEGVSPPVATSAWITGRSSTLIVHV